MAEENTNAGTGSGSGEGSPGVGAGGTGDTGQSGETQNAEAARIVNQIKTQRDALKAEVDTLKSRKFVSDDDFADLERLRTEDTQRKTEVLEQKGEFDKLREQLQETHSGALSAKDGVIVKLQGSLSKEIVDSKIFAAATDKAHDPAKVVKLLRSNISLTFTEDGEYAISIVDDSKNKVYDDNGNPIGLVAFVQKYLKDNPDLQSSNAISGSGGGNDQDAKGAGSGSRVVGTGADAVRIPTMDEQSRMTDPKEIKELRAKLKKAGAV